MANERLRAAVAMGLLLMVGLIVGGWLLGGQIRDTKLADRYVTVRGLTERVVKADVAIWNLNFKESGDDLSAVFAKSERDKGVTLKFLADQGIAAKDIAIGSAQVADRQTNEYQASDKGPRYVVEQSVQVQTRQVDAVAAAEQKASALVQEGVILTNANGQSSIKFNFTGLNTIKPDMITEATKNARAAADRFAADSGSKVGGDPAGGAGNLFDHRRQRRQRKPGKRRPELRWAGRCQCDEEDTRGDDGGLLPGSVGFSEDATAQAAGSPNPARAVSGESVR